MEDDFTSDKESIDISVFEELMKDEARYAELMFWVVRSPHQHTVLHKKGGIYRYMKQVRHSDDKSLMVLYDHLWPNEIGSWVRPYEEFMDGRFMSVVMGNHGLELRPFPVYNIK